MTSLTDPYFDAVQRVFEPPFLGTYAEFSEQNFRMPGSAISLTDAVDFAETPWNTDVLNDADPIRGVNFNTFVKPVQGAGSGNGECAIACWLKFLDRGSIQYNWEDDDKAGDIWKSVSRNS